MYRDRKLSVNVSFEDHVPEQLGLRERKKRETRRSLSEVATRLFAERGFDAVTVSEVAAAAGVSDKTVFNYFETKEDLVLEGRREVEAELIRALHERPAAEPVIETVRRHTLAVAERMHALPAWRRSAFRRIVQNTPSVHARMRQLSLEHEAQLAGLLAEAAASEADVAGVIASVFGVLTRLGFGFAGVSDRKRRSHDEVVASIHAAFDLLSAGLAKYGAGPRVKRQLRATASSTEK
jgi:AcrR family transcriptional regulator